MALHGQKPIPEKGDIMNSLLAGPGGLELDVFKGIARLKNPTSHPRHNPWYELEELRPRLVHFLGTDILTHPYRQEVIRLKLVCGKGWPVWSATLWTKLVFSWPWLFREKFKNTFRPLYHAMFGRRAVPKSSRG